MRATQTATKTAKNTPKGSGAVRIIGGEWRGRKLSVITSEGLRPTGDRVRETLFNWLMHKTYDIRCLDAFAGSGALGFEALSRGAKHCTFIEKSTPASKQLSSNLAMLKCTKATVLNQDCLTILKQPCNDPFDLIFLDPPFNKGLLAPCLEHLLTQQWLADHAYLYIEAEKDLHLPLSDQFAVLKHKTSGAVQSWLLCFSQQSVNEQEPPTC